jgi:hypothetical protein
MKTTRYTPYGEPEVIPKGHSHRKDYEVGSGNRNGTADRSRESDLKTGNSPVDEGLNYKAPL